MQRRRRRFVRLAAAGLLPLAGCLSGGGDGATSGGTTGTGTTAATTSRPATSSTAAARERFPGYEWSKLDGVDPVATSTVRMTSSSFRPLVAAVTPGTTVTVENTDGYEHSFVAPRLGIDESVPGGGSTSFAVESTGTFEYVCTVHPPGMLGRLVVTETPPTATPTPTPTPTSSPTPGSTPTATPRYDNLVRITVEGVFDPERIAVDPGETVTWENEGTTHTVTSTRFHDTAERWSMDEELDYRETASHTFERSGVYEYYCTIHGKAQMCGAVLVGDVTLEQPLPCE